MRTKRRHSRKVGGFGWCLLVGVLIGYPPLWAWDRTFVFTEDPFAAGWRVLGVTNLFVWKASEGVMEIRWDSSQPNSAFYLPLDWTLDRRERFAIEWEMTVAEVHAGVRPGKPFAFELAVGFFRKEDVVAEGFRRGTGVDARNLVEWDFFPDTGYGATVWPTVISSEGRFNYNSSSDYVIWDLPIGKPVRGRLTFDGKKSMLETEVWVDGQQAFPPLQVPLHPSFSNFQVDAVGFLSYSDAGSNGSLQARAMVRWVRVTVPDRPIRSIRLVRGPQGWVVRFQGRSGWRYELLESEDLRHWTVVTECRMEADGWVELPVPVSKSRQRFYRVRTERME